MGLKRRFRWVVSRDYRGLSEILDAVPVTLTRASQLLVR